MSALVGIQMGAISFVDEGVEPVLDLVKERVGANAIFVSTQAFDRGVQGRQVQWRPWPGHGPKELDDHWGGSYVTQHPEFYANTALAPYRAPDKEVAGFDALGDVLPAAHERDIKVYSFVLENTHSGLARAVPNWPKVLQEDAWGRADSYACLRNPDYVNWWLGIVEDQVKSYPIDGLMFGSERNGPLGNVLGNGGFARDGRPYCFCRYCVDAGIQRGIDPLRAREGYRLLYELARGSDPDDQLGDSAFVRFLRILLKYPEIIAWDALWHDGYESLQKRIYGSVKLLAPEVQVGWHVWHHNSFSPLYRAQLDFHEIAGFSDFVKPVLYNNAAGYRLHNHIREVASSIFAGVPEDAIYALYRGSLGYDEDMRFDDLPGAGLSADYVLRETRRTVAAVAGEAFVYPGLDVDVPTPEHVKKTDPQEIRGSIAAALDGGADGYVLSRKYSEMSIDNLDAAGAAFRAYFARIAKIGRPSDQLTKSALECNLYSKHHDPQEQRSFKVKSHRTRRPRVITIATVAAISTVALMLAGCSNSTPSSSGTAGKDGKNFSVLFTTEDSQTPAMLKLLAANQCKAENKALPLSIQQTPSANLQQKVQLLAAQGALPLLYAADNSTIIPGGVYYKNGEVLDINKALTEAGVADDMTDVAKSTIEQTFKGTVPSLPVQFNIEGIFYNKKIFADNGLTVPTTYDELMSDAAKLKAAGVTPITASGAAGWPISRWIGILLFRELGPDAMKAIADGSAKLTDPEYVKAAQQLQTMGKDGYFNKGITNLDYNTAVSQLLTGKAAMMYMGTWLLAQINDPKQNTQGNNIGFMPFPAVTGGKGSIDQYPANAGSSNVMNTKLYGPKAEAWLKCIAQNYGSASLKEQGTFSGFKLNQAVTTLPPLTSEIGKTIDATKQSVLWFEAYFGVKANADASSNAAALLTGQMTPMQYMSILQADQSQP